VFWCFDQGNSTVRTMDAVGAFTVGVGGTFTIANNQPAGVYAADFDVTADLSISLPAQ
jgi:hypothetical protein